MGSIDETPLTLAALNGRAKINQTTKNGMTALMFASYGDIGGAKDTLEKSDYLEVVKTLISMGADKEANNSQGQTALDLAKEHHRNQKIIQLLK